MSRKKDFYGEGSETLGQILAQTYILSEVFELKRRENRSLPWPLTMAQCLFGTYRLRSSCTRLHSGLGCARALLSSEWGLRLQTPWHASLSAANNVFHEDTALTATKVFQGHICVCVCLCKPRCLRTPAGYQLCGYCLASHPEKWFLRHKRVSQTVTPQSNAAVTGSSFAGLAALRVLGWWFFCLCQSGGTSSYQRLCLSLWEVSGACTPALSQSGALVVLPGLAGPPPSCRLSGAPSALFLHRPSCPFLHSPGTLRCADAAQRWAAELRWWALRLQGCSFPWRSARAGRARHQS